MQEGDVGTKSLYIPPIRPLSEYCQGASVFRAKRIKLLASNVSAILKIIKKPYLENV
jgi:hypothetical protein